MMLHVLIAMVAGETHRLTRRERISHIGGPLADAGEGLDHGIGHLASMSPH